MKNIHYVLLFVLVVQLCSGARFDIVSVSTCTKQSEKGYCTRWEQNGTVEEQYGACFPAHAKVIALENGNQVVKEMKDINIGDHVLSLNDGIETYSEIIAWIHHSTDKEINYLQVETDKGIFTTSQSHNLALNDKSYVFARQIQGQILYGQNKVLSTKTIKETGMYAPLTRNGNYFVVTDQENKILAHDFAHIRNPQFWHPIFKFVTQAYEAIFGRPESSMTIHPTANLAMKALPFLLEE